MRRFFEPVSAPSWLKGVLTSVKQALGDIFDTPIRPFQAATADLPSAADWTGGLAWDTTNVWVTYSDGTAWQGVQKADATLNALAAYNTNGLVTQTAADTFTGRTITGTANEITVVNGNGGAGNPTLSLPTSLTFTGKTVTGGTFSSIGAVTSTSTITATGSFIIDGQATIAASGAVLDLRCSTTRIQSGNGATTFATFNSTGLALTGAFSCDGNATLGNATGDSHTVNGHVSSTVSVNSSGGLSITDSTRTVRLTASDGGTGHSAVGTYSNHDFKVFRNAAPAIACLANSNDSLVPLKPPSYTVAGLPSATNAGDGALAYATNGRKTGEGAGAGTGVPVYADGGTWYRFADDTAVAA